MNRPEHWIRRDVSDNRSEIITQESKNLVVFIERSGRLSVEDYQHLNKIVTLYNIYGRGAKKETHDE